MGDNSIESSGAFGIPKWMMRKGMRYEIDDFIVSPPSNEDGGFFHLRYGRCSGPRSRPSSHDCANQEVAMTVEVRDGDPVITDIRSPSSSDNNSPSASFTITQGGLSSETTPVSTPDATSGKVEPLLVLPLKCGDSRIGKDNSSIKDAESTEPNVEFSKQDFLSTGQFSVQDGPQQILSESQSSSVKNSIITNEKKERNISLVERVQQIPLEPDSLSPESLSTTDEKKQRKISLVERVQQIPLEPDSLSPESSSTTDENKQRKISLVERVQQIPLAAESLPSKSTPNPSETRCRKISFVERFQMLPFSADQGRDNLSPQRTPPQRSPLVTPHTTPPGQRKPFGVSMEKVHKSTVHSYFCTKPFPGTEQDYNTASDMSSQAGEVSLSSTSSVRAQQLEDNTNLAQSLDPNNKALLGKRRPRPKPSTLREMNFWAPTSM